MTFCERLRELREVSGRTQSDMARIIGMTAPGYKRLEDGTGAKTFKKIPQIAKALGCRIDDLFPEMDEPTEKTARPSASHGPASATGGGPLDADGFEETQDDDDDDSLDCLVM